MVRPAINNQRLSGRTSQSIETFSSEKGLYNVLLLGNQADALLLPVGVLSVHCKL